MPNLPQYRKLKRRIEALYERLESATRLFVDDNRKWGEFARSFVAEWDELRRDQGRVENVEARMILGQPVGDILNMFHAAAFRSDKVRSDKKYAEWKTNYAKDLKELNSYLADLDSKISKERRGEKLLAGEVTEDIDELETKARAQLTLGQALLTKGNKKSAERYFQKVVDEWPMTKAAETAHLELKKLAGN